jgi:putative ABC transport system permease protein
MRPTTFILRLRSLFRKHQVEGELDEEIQYHLQRQIQHYIDKGLNGDEARKAALRHFGGVEKQKEECRDTRRVAWIENALRDFRFGLRALRHNPGFGFSAAATIALGIGAVTAVFSIVYGVVLRPLSYPQPEQLVGVWTTNPQFSSELQTASVANYRDLRESSTVFEDIGIGRLIGNYNLTGDSIPERVLGARVTPSLLRALGVQPLIGRIFAEPERNIEDHVVLSHGLWQRRFGADPAIVGQVIRLSGSPYTVAGVMPPDFVYPNRDFELWTQFTVNPVEYRTRLPFSYAVVARLKKGVSVAEAQTQVSQIAKRLAEIYPANKGIDFRVTPMLEDVVGNVRMRSYVLLGAVLCVLLIGCVNLANLVMARALGRRHELVVRSALGAPKSRLVLQTVMEMAPIIGLGGASGLVLANWILKLVVPLLPQDLPRIENVRVDGHVLLFSAFILVTMAVVTAIWPALQVLRWNVAGVLRESSSRTTTGSGSVLRIRDLLVVSQIAGVVILMVGAALLIRSFAALTRVDPGFRPDKVLSVHLAIPRSKYRTDAAIAQFCKRIIESVEAVPDVESVGMVNRLPLAGGTQIGLVEFDGGALDSDQIGGVDWRTITPDYFRTLGIPLVQGRFFDKSDTENRPMVGIIDEQLARRVFPNESAIGKRFRVVYPGDNSWIEVVGVVGHLRHDSLGTDTRPQIYWNYEQRAQDRMALVVRTKKAPESITAGVISQIHTLDAEQPVYDVRPMNEVVDRSVSTQWLMMTLVSVFAVVALVLASVGIYGVMSYSVGMRTREIGIRMALGSERHEILWTILRYGGRLAGLGLAIGFAGAVGLRRVLGSLLYGISATDAFSFATVAFVLLLVALAACYLPARRAAALDPMSVLRND